MTLGDLAHPYVRIYVNERALPRVLVGATAEGILDGQPKSRYAGRVVAISSKAEFTPRVALTENERADLLFGVKLDISDTTGTFKAGLPATVTIDTTATGRSLP